MDGGVGVLVWDKKVDVEINLWWKSKMVGGW